AIYARVSLASNEIVFEVEQFNGSRRCLHAQNGGIGERIGIQLFESCDDSVGLVLSGFVNADDCLVGEKFAAREIVLWVPHAPDRKWPKAITFAWKDIVHRNIPVLVPATEVLTLVVVDLCTVSQ